MARRIGSEALAPVTARLARAAFVLGGAGGAAVLTDLAHGASESGGYDYAAAWNSLYDGSGTGLLSGLEVTLALTGAVLVAPLAFRAVVGGRARSWLLGIGLATARWRWVRPSSRPRSRRLGPDDFETVIWMAHLFGGATWIGGLAGLLLLALPAEFRRPRGARSGRGPSAGSPCWR